MRTQILIVAATLLALAAAPASAQYVRGVAVDAQTGQRVPEATITLIREQSGGEESSVRSDSLGRFSLYAREAGAYRLRVRRLGYKEATSGMLQLEEGMWMQLDMELAPVASELEPLRVLARRSWREWGKDGFARRRALGKGIFLTRDDMDRVDPVFVTDLLRHVPGIRIIEHADSLEIQSLRGNRCLTILVNRLPVHAGGLPYPHQVMGVEVYRDFREVPEEFQYLAFRSGGSCGVVNFWSARAWDPVPGRE